MTICRAFQRLATLAVFAASTVAIVILEFPACSHVINVRAQEIRRCFQKKLRAQFKNACRATDRFKKCDNVEIDDSAKFAGYEMASLESVIPQRRIIIERAALT